MKFWLRLVVYRVAVWAVWKQHSTEFRCTLSMRISNDIFGIAGLYAEAIARGHAFNDANKRTALACALTFLGRKGIDIPQDPDLEEVVVMLASGAMSGDEFANFLYGIWVDHGKPTVEFDTN